METEKKRWKKEHKKRRIYSEKNFFVKFGLFFYYLFKDIKNRSDNPVFEEYGMTIFCGKQGAGKTTAMVEYLERMRKKYPEVLILTNFNYANQDYPLLSFEDLLEFKNGDKGIIFAIDELQNEFDSTRWNDFPEFLLSQITQQRKQRIKIVGTTQVFTRVVKQIREQTFEVVECITLAGRWTFTKAFDAYEYNNFIDQPDRIRKLKRLYRKNFVQDDDLRKLFNSYDVIDKIKNTEYVPREERLSNIK